MTKQAKVILILIVAQTFFSIAFAEKFRYDRQDKRDPFFISTDRPQTIESTTTASPAHFKLEGVIVDPNGASMAIIDGTIIKLGEKVGGYQVKKISKDGVLFSDGDRDIWVAIRTEE